MASRVLRWGLWLTVAVLVLAVAGEMTARLFLGLGDPPLWVADAEIEYLCKPSMEYRRFGRRVAYNAYSMRSDPFPPTKNNPLELRVLIMGDSVVNGGSLVDQSRVVSERLKSQLTEELDRPVVVGNIGAGSWGPANLLAYVRRFGWFDADVVVIVLSSHDYADEPTFEPVVGIRSSFPDKRPWLALQELWTRYLPRYLPFGHNTSPRYAPDTRPNIEAIDRTRSVLRQLLRSAQAAVRHVAIAQHLEKSELRGQFKPGHAVIGSLARELGMTVIELGPAMAASLDRGHDPYHDRIHPNAQGHDVICQTIFRAIKTYLTEIQSPQRT